MFADAKELKKQVMSIVTDSTPLEDPKDPDNNVAKIYNLFVGIDKQNEMKEKFLAGNYGYGTAKKELLETILTYFGEARERRAELAKNPDLVRDILRDGSRKARAIAIDKVQKAKEIVGLVGNTYELGMKI